MSFLSSFLKSTQSIEPTQTLQPEIISVGTLKELIPIRNFSKEKLEAFATNLKSEIYPKGTTLFSFGESTDFALYLLKGDVLLADNAANHYEVKDGSAKARFPLSSGAVNTTTAVTQSEVSVLRVSQKIMSSSGHNSTHLTQFIIPIELENNHLLHTFSDHFATETLQIPTLPDVAIKLRNALHQDVDLAEAAKIIQLDPVISAKLIELANCPLYVCPTPVRSCLEAIKRIGLSGTRNMVISLSIHQLFKSHSTRIGQVLDQVWRGSVYMSTLCYVLAKATKQANPEEAMLAGLICDLGSVPFLHFADNLPKDYFTDEELLLALSYAKGPIGHKILSEWGFSEEFVKIPLYSEDWYQDFSDNLSLLDIVILARLHNAMGKPEGANLPVVTSIPAASKLKDYSLSPELSLNILHNAKQQITEALKVLAN